MSAFGDPDRVTQSTAPNLFGTGVFSSAEGTFLPGKEQTEGSNARVILTPSGDKERDSERKRRSSTSSTPRSRSVAPQPVNTAWGCQSCPECAGSSDHRSPQCSEPPRQPWIRRESSIQASWSGETPASANSTPPGKGRNHDQEKWWKNQENHNSAREKLGVVEHEAGEK
ncbi:hypothetical protein [Pseudonocardia alaniniphila]|uniref:hypothetical protein n=1 Tax=Pseudonocardia alaniniphila TaxID=75291 RepID=UPI003385F92B